MYQPGQRHPPVADPSRQYVPPPPPMSPPAQQSFMSIPPPPPRPMGHQHTGLIIPPPPGPPPSGMQSGWQNNWGRTYDSRGFPLPPPNPLTNTPHQPYNPSQSYANQQPPPLSIPPPPASEHMMSATYIPHGDSFGPGVGIPGFGRHDLGFGRDGGDFSANSERSSSRDNFETQTLLDGNSYYPDRYPAQTPVARYNNIQLPEYNSPGPPTATIYNPQLGPRGNEIHQQAHSSQTSTPISPNDVGAQWPMEKVLLWLASNQFSADWQETFKALNIYGSVFLELGSRQGGRGNLGLMHQQVYPRLAKECSNSGTGWDQSREREEGKRMRRLIKSLVTGRPMDATRPSHIGRDVNIPSAGTDGTVESSPNLGRDIPTPSTANGDDDSPASHMFKSPAPSFGNRRFSIRSNTAPVGNSSGNLSGESEPNSSTQSKN